MNEETKISEKSKSNKKKLYYSVAALLVIAALLAGLSYAWFVKKTDIATLVELKPPSGISILGPGGSELTSLDLNYTDKDKNGNTVTIRRVICVQSEENIAAYNLEIVHTTNLKGLTFNLYPVSDTGTEVTDGGYTYKFDSNTKVAGNFLNLNSTTTANYRYANRKGSNYNTDDNVQSHAEPLYWLVNTPLIPNTDNQVKIENKLYNRTYYVCEITWTETTKETDIFYILAQTANVSLTPSE